MNKLLKINFGKDLPSLNDKFMKTVSDQHTIVRLSELEKGTEAVIYAFEKNQSDLGRLSDMGLHIGTNFRIIKFAPGGDPIEIKARGYYMSLRKSAARHILVNKK